MLILYAFFSKGTAEQEKICRACNRNVYKMEEVKAERNIYHKNCFRCSECRKPLRYIEKRKENSNTKFKNLKSMNFIYSIDTYQSHAGILYCKPHFKSLFSPKAVEDSEPGN